MHQHVPCQTCLHMCRTTSALRNVPCQTYIMHLCVGMVDTYVYNVIIYQYHLMYIGIDLTRSPHTSSTNIQITNPNKNCWCVEKETAIVIEETTALLSAKNSLGGLLLLFSSGLCPLGCIAQALCNGASVLIPALQMLQFPHRLQILDGCGVLLDQRSKDCRLRLQTSRMCSHFICLRLVDAICLNQKHEGEQ